ncbi:MAG: tetraacyldisaccharide 4'-kinase [Myxococcaceae bacterium]
MASLPFRAGVAMRSAAYSSGLFKPARIEGAKVISVGNLTVGGSGKTPVVIFLAQWALACGAKVAIQTRGYGRASSSDVVFDSSALPSISDAGDEPRLIARRCPGARVYVGAERKALAERARADGATVVILDDGFQHRQLARDVDLVVVDQLGNGHLMPWGPLREPPSALSRATIAWVKSGEAQGAKAVVRAAHEAIGWIDERGKEHPLEALKGVDLIALAGIARPERFLASIRATGATVASSHLRPDHHLFTSADLERVREDVKRLGTPVVTTEKDAERLPEDFPVWKLRLGVQVTEGAEPLAAALGWDGARRPR